MARNKEALLLLIDVGPSMHSLLPEVEKVCSMLIQKKLVYGKSDEVGVILFGTKGTNNVLTKEVGGYEHVTVLRDIKCVDGDLVDAMQNLPCGTDAGDYLDAIVVGMDMLIKKFGTTNKGKKRLCLITNAECPIKDPFEGTKADQVSTIAVQMTAHGMKMESIVVREKLSADGNRKIMDENDFLLNLFSEHTHAKAVYVEDPTSLLGAVRTRNISPVTIYRGDLELSPKLKIKVWVYKKTSEERLPTLRKYSDMAPSTDKKASHEVKLDYEYKSVQDTPKVVPPEQRIRGFRYGPEVVPISSAELETLKFKPEKSVKILGFTDASNIMRHYYLKDVNIFIAEPGNRKAVLAVSSLAKTMKKTNKVAILRCVWRQGQSNLVVGVLTPNISNRRNIPDSFYFNVLPFAEDVREFQFPSFCNLPSSCQPSEEQQEAVDNLVRTFDLAPTSKAEVLVPDFTPNPVLERFYRCLEVKSKCPEAAIPPLDSTLKRITEPDPELFSQKTHVIEEIRNRFELKENPKLKKFRKRILQHRHFHSNDIDKRSADAATTSSVDDAEGVESIGDSTPVQDFEAMMSRRDSAEWVGKAIKNMKNKIFNLVEDSYEGDNYPKAVECLVALRKGCILEQEPKQFNDFLHHTCRFCREQDLISFCEFLGSKDMTLITKAEAADSDVPDEEARSFLANDDGESV